MVRALAVWRRTALLSVAIGLAVVSVGAQGRGAASDPVALVRIALGHGDVVAARTIAEAVPPANAPARELGLALVAVFEGKHEDARARLTPLAERAPLGDASLELGLLDLATGRRAEARRRLDALASVRSFSGPDDFFRLARAARGTREFLLANDAYQRIADVPRADIQTEWGDMFFERHQPGDAVTNYRKALEIDAQWVPAMLGLARALASENPAESRKQLEAARAQAPGHPDVALVTAQQRLEAEDPAGAAAALDELAAIQPNTIEEAAERMAVIYKERGIEALDESAARARAIDPTSGLGYRRASEQAAHDYRFDDSAALARKAIEADPDDAAAHFSLGLALMRTGDEPAARTALETSWDLDKSAPLTKNLLDLLDRLDGFDIVSHEDFIFKFAKEETAVMRVFAIPLAEEAYRQFVERYGITPKGPLLVEVFPRHDDFAVRTLGLPGLVGALGACFGRVVTMDSPRARPPGDFSWQATLWHELAHVFTLQASDYRVPRWLTEGVSTYEEHRRQPAWGRELTLEFANRLAKGENFGVKKLPQAFKRPETLSLAYFEASLLVEHLVALNGEAGLRTLLQAYGNRDKDDQAFAKAFGRSVDDVEKSFAAFLDERYAGVRDAMADPPSQVAPTDVAALRARAEKAPGNFLSQLALGRALLRSGDATGAREPLERAAALVPMAMGEESPKALLAGMVEKTDPARARRLLRELLTYDHTNIGAARRLAALASAGGDAANEDYALALVAELDPFDAVAHSRLGGRLLAKGDAAGALREFQAALAIGPANLAEAHADAAEALLKLGRRQEARREALEALQQAPTFARAQDLLLEASEP
ncbi:MAG: tetratricopeptide repeat protein [Acidobacteria bacterium]|nr:tetratricopeptide repeat protein [Acidobacteriota bacterium]